MKENIEHQPGLLLCISSVQWIFQTIFVVNVYVLCALLQLMYVGDDGTTDEMLVAAELARCGQPPTGDGPCPDQSNAYHPRQQTTVLVLSDLVHHISPILSLR